jgi:hypothetical protein
MQGLCFTKCSQHGMLGNFIWCSLSINDSLSLVAFIRKKW